MPKRDNHRGGRHRNGHERGWDGREAAAGYESNAPHLRGRDLYGQRDYGAPSGRDGFGEGGYPTHDGAGGYGPQGYGPGHPGQGRPGQASHMPTYADAKDYREARRSNWREDQRFGDHRSTGETWERDAPMREAEYGGVDRRAQDGWRAQHAQDDHYRRWREQQLAAHDEDYARWRREQADRYDQAYRSRRDHRRS